jgi:hypothetical protein
MLNGKMTEFAMFNKTLSSAEINEIMNYGLRPTTSGVIPLRMLMGIGQ